MLCSLPTNEGLHQLYWIAMEVTPGTQGLTLPFLAWAALFLFAKSSSSVLNMKPYLSHSPCLCSPNISQSSLEL